MYYFTSYNLLILTCLSNDGCIGNPLSEKGCKGGNWPFLARPKNKYWFIELFSTILYEIYLPEYPGTRLEFLRASNCAELDKELWL